MINNTKRLAASITFFFIVSILIASSAVSVSAAETLSDMYPGSWKTDINMDIVVTLGKNNIRGCGEFYYRVNKNEPSGYLVKCTSDGENYLLMSGFFIIAALIVTILAARGLSSSQKENEESTSETRTRT